MQIEIASKMIRLISKLEWGGRGWGWGKRPELPSLICFYFRKPVHKTKN